MANIEVHETEGWSAVYLDGNLVSGPSDSYLADEWLREHFGVTTIQDNAFMLGQDTRAGVALTLIEIERYRTERTEQLFKAAKMREEAERLSEAASEIMQEWSPTA